MRKLSTMKLLTLFVAGTLAPLVSAGQASAGGFFWPHGHSSTVTRTHTSGTALTTTPVAVSGLTPVTMTANQLTLSPVTTHQLTLVPSTAQQLTFTPATTPQLTLVPAAAQQLALTPANQQLTLTPANQQLTLNPAVPYYVVQGKNGGTALTLVPQGQDGTGLAAGGQPILNGLKKFIQDLLKAELDSFVGKTGGVFNQQDLVSTLLTKAEGRLGGLFPALKPLIDLVISDLVKANPPTQAPDGSTPGTVDTDPATGARTFKVTITGQLVLTPAQANGTGPSTPTGTTPDTKTPVTNGTPAGGNLIDSGGSTAPTIP